MGRASRDPRPVSITVSIAVLIYIYYILFLLIVNNKIEVHKKNDFLKILLERDLKIILLNHQNNYVGN